MKFIITSTGDSLESKFDLRFGRAGWFCVYDTDSESVEFIKNENKDAKGGAGTKSVEKVADLGAGKVISGDFGPKAKALLERLNIQMVVFNDDSLTVKEIIEKIKN